MAPQRTWQQIADICRRLDGCDIEQMSWDLGSCPTCGSEKYGLLDESRVILPFPKGPFQGRTSLHEALVPLGGIVGDGAFFTTTTGPHVAETDSVARRYASYTPYMVIMDIVRSGMFTEEQLLGAEGTDHYGLVFSRHELEINAKAFKALRPETCDCTGWGTPRGSDFGEEFNLPVEPGLDLERDFVSGKPVRTGFRIRSPDARKARSLKKRNRKMVVIRPDSTMVVKFLAKPSEVILNLSFKYVPHGDDIDRKTPIVKAAIYSWRKGRRSAVKRHLVPNRAPLRAHKKYWYFTRKFGQFCLSEHHPHVDDHLYSRYGFRKPVVPRAGCSMEQKTVA